MNTHLQGIDLTDTAVMGWEQKNDTLEFDLDISIWPTSEFYLEPQKKEWTCYRRGSLRFNDVVTICGLKKMTDTVSSTDPDGSKDFGNIDHFEERNGKVLIIGDFGRVTIECSSWALKIN
jgi:hypothetical protein